MSMSRTERISHYGVLLIAITAVVVSVWQGRISQKQLELSIQHNKLTVKPYLDITRFTDSSEGTLEVNLANQGYGPAVVKSFELEYEGKTYSNWNAVLNAAGESNNISYLRNYADGSVIAPGRDDVLCRLQTKFDQKEITIRIRYESIYEEAFEVDFTF